MEEPIPKRPKFNDDFSIPTVERHVLDLIDEGVLILHGDEGRQVHFINKKLEKMTGFTFQELRDHQFNSQFCHKSSSELSIHINILPFIVEEQEFFQVIQQLVPSSSPSLSPPPSFISKDFHVHNAKDSSYCYVTVIFSLYMPTSLSPSPSPLPLRPHVCCIFKLIQVPQSCSFPSISISPPPTHIDLPKCVQSDSERYKWFSIVDKMSPIKYAISEYDEQLNDFKQIFWSRAALTQYQNRWINPANHGTDKLDEAVVGKYSIRDLGFQREDIDWWIDSFKQIKNTDKMLHSQHQVTMPSGEKVTLSTSICFVGFSESGNPCYLQIGEDVTRYTRMESEIQKRRQQVEEMMEKSSILKCFFDYSPVMMGVLELKDDGPTHVFANPTAQQFIENRSSSINRISDVLSSTPITSISTSNNNNMDTDHPATNCERKYSKIWVKYCQESEEKKIPIQFECSSQDAFSDSTSPPILSLDAMTATGSPSATAPTDIEPMSLSCSVHSIGGNRYAFVAADVSHHKRLQRELLSTKDRLEDTVKARTKMLEEALEVKGRFLATMSHEIRTPLSGIMGMMNLLDATPLTSEQREYIHIAQVCGEQLLIIINDILDLSKLEENKVSLDSSEFSLVDLLEDSLEVVSCDAEKKNLELVSDWDRCMRDKIVGDPIRIRQILINLLSNAVKFSSRGNVILTAESHDVEENHGDGVSTTCQILCSVADQGIGIKDSAKQYLFQPFSQADNSVTRKYGGSGLGLCISKRLCELMGGRMWFESQENIGSTFYFTVLVRTSQRNLPSEYQTTDLTGLVTFIVDRNVTISEILKKRLSDWGCSAQTFLSISQVLNYLSQNSTNPILTVIFIDGGQDLGNIEKLYKFGKVVLMGSKTLSQGLKFPMLTKPIHSASLLSTLQSSKASINCNDTTDSISNATSKDLLCINIIPQRTIQPHNKQRDKDTRILVVEDNILNQFVIQKLLKSLGFNLITTVCNGVEALRIVKCSQQKFHVVLMDMMMPEMGGIECTELIKKEVEQKLQPECIIALTANAFEEDRNRCLQAGMDHVLLKPVERPALIEILSRFIQHDPQ